MNDNWTYRASQQWRTRPDDERFLSLDEMLEHFEAVRANSAARVVANRRIVAMPEDDNQGMVIEVDDERMAPTHFSFGQLANLADAPAGYLRKLPSPIAADCVNYGLQFRRDIEEVGLLSYKNGGPPTLRAATGPRYGRIWNAPIVEALIRQFGDGVSGDGFRVPGEFGMEVPITRQNTTLYASDRDMFVFLADERNRIEVPNRRDGKTGSLARGFFVWNSEVGDKTFGLAKFLMDFACMNRIIWGGQDYEEITIRHTASAPQRFIEEIAPALESYAKSSTMTVTQAIEDARSKRLDDVDSFLKNRFGARLVDTIKATHQLEEGRPIETVWDAVTGITAYAKSIQHQDARIAVEREAGKLLV